MKYKILIKTENDGIDYFRFYKISSSEADWESVDKDETIAKFKELLEIYSLSELKLMIGLDVDITMDIPELPEEESSDEVEEEPSTEIEEEPSIDND